MTDIAEKLKLLAGYLSYGWPVLPCEVGGKKPLTLHGVKDASTDPQVVRAWLDRYPDCNWGIRCGQISGLLVVDIDHHKVDGFETWDALRWEHPEAVETPTVKTGGAGMHLYFKFPKDRDVRPKASALGPGVDIRANDSYIIAPPSVTQAPYTFEIHPEDQALQECPQWILDMIPIQRKNPAPVVAIPNVIPEGARNDRLFRLACSFRGKDMSEDEIYAAVSAINMRCDPPLNDDELKALVASAAKYGQGMADTTDVANAYRFVNLYSGKMLYCNPLETWLIWDGKRWRKDDILQTHEMALKVADVIRDEVEAATDSTTRKELARGWALAKDGPNINAFLNLAKSLLPVRPNELDKATGFLNVANGILDMSSGELSPHDPKRYITKLLDVNYDPDVTCPKWDAFLVERVPKEENREYLQRIIGYAVSGRSDGKRVPFIFGAPDTGKSTFLETLKMVAGDYCTKTNINLILSSSFSGSSEAPSPLLRELFGARMVIASEIPKGRTVNDGIFKDLSGGDSFIARGLHEAPVSDRPTHCLVLYGNEKPRFKDLTGATANRMAIVGFNVIIPPEIRRDLLDVLAVFMAERSGILNWIIQGYRSYLTYGLRDTADVASARREYETEQDVIQRFLGEQCDFHDDYSIQKADLYAEYKKWCEESNERPESRAAFIREIVRKGYSAYGHGGSQIKGLQMATGGSA